MPKYLVAGTVSVLVEAVTNWDSAHYEDRNGEISFDAPNVESARKHVARLVAGRTMSHIHGLYMVRGDNMIPVAMMSQEEREKIVQALKVIVYPKEGKRYGEMLDGLSDGELDQLLANVRHAAWSPLSTGDKRAKLIDTIVELLKPESKKLKLVRSYLKEFPENMLEHMLTHVGYWKKDGGKMFISASLSVWLRPTVAKELFDS